MFNRQHKTNDMEQSQKLSITTKSTEMLSIH